MAGSLRAVVKDRAERTMAAFLRHRLRSGSATPAGAVLAFHNVVPDGTDVAVLDASLHLTLSRFQALVDAVAGLPNTRIVPLSEVEKTGREALRVAITFDDAYRGAVRLGLAALAERSLPATVFVAPGILGAPSMWWDRERAAVESEEAWERRREALLAPPSCGLDARIPSRATSPRPSCEEAGIATLDELRAACRDGLVEVGCHTWSHACLPALDTDACRDELRRSRDWLVASGLPYRPVHAFPYGRWSDRAVDLLKELGIERAMRIDGGVIRGGHGFCLPRINVPAGISAAGLLVRLAGYRDA